MGQSRPATFNRCAPGVGWLEVRPVLGTQAAFEREAKPSAIAGNGRLEYGRPAILAHQRHCFCLNLWSGVPIQSPIVRVAINIKSEKPKCRAKNNNEAQCTANVP